jgi:hypothetical protein
MVRWHDDPNEESWMDEGLAQVAERISGYDQAFTHYNYLFDSRVQLNSWSQDFRESYSHYGAGYLYMLYLWERLGTDAVRQIARSPASSFAAVDEGLAPLGTSADAVFADWIVANYVNDPSIEDGRYGYTTESLIPVCPRTRLAQARTIPPTSSLPQYSAHYVELEGEGEFDISFRGDTEVGLIPVAAYSGQSFWWSNRADRSDMTLTRAFDLRQPREATLQFWTWYDMEEHGDVGFVEVSTDGGQSWQFLSSTNMFDDPDDEFGPYFTGTSGGGTHPTWAYETIDLTPFVGQEVLVRWEIVTNGAYNGYGWAIDNVRIPELNYLYDVEAPQDGWQAEGFVRTANRVPQSWTLSLVTYDGGAARVQRLDLAPDGTASATVTLAPESRRATLIVGAMAPATRVEAAYHLNIGGPGVMDRLDYPPGVLLQDDFSSPCSTFLSFVLPDYSFGYREGHYEISIDLEDQIIWGYTDQEFTDTIIDVDTLQVDPAPDSTTGIVCRWQDQFNFYTFEIRNDGTYQVLLVDDGIPTELQPWTESFAIRTGEGAENHLQVSCVGDELTFTVNGTYLAGLVDDSIHRGDLGFTAGTFDTPGIRVTFDNLVVRAP